MGKAKKISESKTKPISDAALITSPADIVTTPVLAALLKLSDRQILRLLKAGWLAQPFRVGESVSGFIKYRDDLDARRKARDVGRDQLVTARTSAAEWRLDRFKAEYIRTHLVFETVDEILEPLLADLRTIPAKFSADPAIRARLAASIAGIENETRARCTRLKKAVGPTNGSAPEIESTRRKLGIGKHDALPFGGGRPRKSRAQ